MGDRHGRLGMAMGARARARAVRSGAADPRVTRAQRRRPGRQQEDRLIAGAAGYIIGLRVVQAWVAAHGADSWQDIYDLPVAEVLERSGYARQHTEGAMRTGRDER